MDKTYPTSVKELVDWLNNLAHSVGIAKSEINPEGFECTEDNFGK